MFPESMSSLFTPQPCPLPSAGLRVPTICGQTGLCFHECVRLCTGLNSELSSKTNPAQSSRHLSTCVALSCGWLCVFKCGLTFRTLVYCLFRISKIKSITYKKCSPWRPKRTEWHTVLESDGIQIWALIRLLQLPTYQLIWALDSPPIK